VESSTKERLTGALLVVLALVVVAPGLFSGRQPAGRGTPPAQNPEDGAPLQTYNVQLDASSAPAAPRDVPAATAAEIAAVPPPVTQDASPVGAAPVATNAPPVEQPAAPAVVPAGKWWVQVGSFESGDNAQRLAKKLRAAGYTIDVSRSRTKGKDLYRVRAGPVTDRAAASLLQDRLATAGEKNSSLVAP
jgi:cell division septation protein DedD